MQQRLKRCEKSEQELSDVPSGVISNEKRICEKVQTQTQSAR